jgi:peptidoglycan hydrolase-like protein with peptidoglycan-binding domain
MPTELPQQQVPAPSSGDGGGETLAKGAGYGPGGPDATIAQLQERLNELGYQIVVDGKYGVYTEYAVKAFQRHRGIKPSGEVDAMTLGELRGDQRAPDAREADSHDCASQRLNEKIEATLRDISGWTEPSITTQWTCELCGAPAGSVSIDHEGHAYRTGFTGSMNLPLREQDAESLRRALTFADPAAVFAIDYELMPWWCPQCETSYCGEHWDHWAIYDPDQPSWLESIHGICPKGHRRKLED